MKVYFGQIYVEPGIVFPFSHLFQRRLSREVTSRVKPSMTFVEKYGIDWELMFRISAKTQIDEMEIRGPSVYKADKDVEYVLFLPFDVIARSECVPKSALRFLFNGFCDVLRQLDVDTADVEGASESIIGDICSDATMFE